MCNGMNSEIRRSLLAVSQFGEKINNAAKSSPPRRYGMLAS